VIYLDSSVVLARLLTEPRTAPDMTWNDVLVSSRLLEYEVWNRIHAHQLTQLLGETTQRLLEHVVLLDLSRTVVARAIDPFPVAVRTLDALHLASIEYLRREGQPVRLATYDRRMIACARALDIALYEL
jgi:predicted nucleic acid-binding protein